MDHRPGGAAHPAARRRPRPAAAAWATHAGDLDAFADASKDHDAIEELRLGYVAVTRPRTCWSSSCVLLGPAQDAARPVVVPATIREADGGWGAEPEQWLDKPDEGRDQPAAPRIADRRGRSSRTDAEVDRRLDAAALRARRDRRRRRGRRPTSST